MVLALLTNGLGPVLHLPQTVPTYTIDGWQQYPLFTFLVMMLAIIFLFSEKNMGSQNQNLSASFAQVLYIALMSIMVVANVFVEGGFRAYILVQALALIALAVAVIYPRYISRKIKCS